MGEEEHQYHGDHWGCLFEAPKDFVKNHLQEALQSGKFWLGWGSAETETMAAWQRDYYGTFWHGGDLRTISLIRINSERRANEVVSFYPWIATGVQHQVILDAVRPWEQRAEAWLDVTLDQQPLAGLTFFDSQFALNSHAYREGETYQFILGALAYRLEVFKPEPMFIKNPEAVAALVKDAEKTGDTIPREPDGTIRIETKGMAALLSIEKWGPDDYSFRGPVKEITELDFLGRKVWKLRVTVLRFDDDVDLDIYLCEANLAGEKVPEVGDDVMGSLWLQGHLWHTGEAQD